MTWAAGLLVALLALGATSPAAAVEYRLRVASLYESAFASFLRPGELGEGASGPGLERLEAALYSGAMPDGVLLWDRVIQAAVEDVAVAHGGVPVRARIRQAGEAEDRWDEAVWDGKPGEVSVWVIRPSSRRPQRVVRLALRGEGPLRHYEPFSGVSGPRAAATKAGLGLVWFQEERGAVPVSRALGLPHGIGVLVAENTDPVFADHVYVIVKHAEGPATYEAVMAWREVPEDFDLPYRKRHWR
jgi:hypothetical protein